MSTATQSQIEKTELKTDAVTTNSHNPADLNKIIGNQPDLATLAKLVKKTKK